MRGIPRKRSAKLWPLAAMIAVTLLGVGAWRMRGGSTPAKGPLAGHLLTTPVAFEGRVDQRLDAGSYGYLHVAREGAGEAWVVAVAPRARIGDRVHVNAVGRAEHFASKRLGRSFDELWFAAVRTID